MMGESAFRSLQEEENRRAWNADCLKMYGRASYTVITVGVDKVAFYHHHSQWDKECLATTSLSSLAGTD
jgi:hypothetical protein